MKMEPKPVPSLLNSLRIICQSTMVIDRIVISFSICCLLCVLFTTNPLLTQLRLGLWGARG